MKRTIYLTIILAFLAACTLTAGCTGDAGGSHYQPGVTQPIPARTPVPSEKGASEDTPPAGGVSKNNPVSGGNATNAKPTPGLPDSGTSAKKPDTTPPSVNGEPGNSLTLDPNAQAPICPGNATCPVSTKRWPPA